MTQYSSTSDPRLCPTCGQCIPESLDMFVVDKFLIFEGRKYRLSPKEIAIMTELITGMRDGYEVTVDHLIAAMYKDTPPQSARQALAVFINSLRRKFRNSNLRITNEYTVYRLSLI